MYLKIRTVYIIVIFSNFIVINCLVKLMSNKELPYSEIAPRGIINKVFTDLKLIIGNKTDEFSEATNYLNSVILKDHNSIRDIIKLIKVDYKNDQTDLIGIINKILDEVDNGTQVNKVITNDARIIEFVESVINDIDNWTVWLNLNDVDKEPLPRLTDYSRSNLKYNINDTFSDDEFWQPSGRRIFHGDRTKIKYFPFMASVEIFQSFQCGGSIIKSDLVITAASCLQLAWNNRFYRENPAFLSVRVGSTFYKGGGESIPVIEVYFHPRYNPKNLYNNLCLLRLRRRLKFSKRNKKVKKIDIDRTPMSLPSTTDGITVLGWGPRGTSNILEDPWRSRLSFSVLDFYPLRECRHFYSSEYVTSKNFCAGYFSKGGGACNIRKWHDDSVSVRTLKAQYRFGVQRDAGGPGVVNGILTGVISFGSSVCGASDAPTVFTKLGYYSDWIDEIMAQDVPYAYKRTTLKPTRIVPYIAATTPTSKTTFVIPPIVGPMKPIPINEIDTLRIVNDETLFNEFLKTVFESEKSDTIGHIRNTAKNNLAQNVPVTYHYEEPLTKLNFEESSEIVTEINKKFTVIDDNAKFDLEKDLEKDIVTLMRNIDVNKNVESMESSGIEAENTEPKDVTETSIEVPNLQKSNKELKQINDSILTLLYLSDSEKKGDVSEDIEDIYNGLTIPAKSFKDMTFRNYKTDNLSYISENDLYDLLTEALNKAEVNNVE